jgi:hypothetical protein
MILGSYVWEGYECWKSLRLKILHHQMLLLLLALLLLLRCLYVCFVSQVIWGQKEKIYSLERMEEMMVSELKGMAKRGRSVSSE